MKGKPQPVIRIRDNKWYPTILAAAVDNGLDPMGIRNRCEIEYQFKRVEMSPEQIECKRKIKAEKRRQYQARYYSDNPERYKRHNMSAKQRREALNGTKDNRTDVESRQDAARSDGGI